MRVFKASSGCITPGLVDIHVVGALLATALFPEMGPLWFRVFAHRVHFSPHGSSLERGKSKNLMSNFNIGAQFQWSFPLSGGLWGQPDNRRSQSKPAPSLPVFFSFFFFFSFLSVFLCSYLCSWSLSKTWNGTSRRLDSTLIEDLIVENPMFYMISRNNLETHYITIEDCAYTRLKYISMPF